MLETIVTVSSLSKTLLELIPTEKVKLTQSNGVISLVPFLEVRDEVCPLLGLASDSTLTVEKFLAMTREDKKQEGLGE